MRDSSQEFYDNYLNFSKHKHEPRTLIYFEYKICKNSANFRLPETTGEY